MHEYDSVLKSLLTGSQNNRLSERFGAKRGRWLNVELPKVNQLRVDLLFEVASTRELLSFELLSHNQTQLPLRVAEYSLAVVRYHQRFPKPYVLYVGNKPMRMPFELNTPYLTCRYTLIDIREWEADSFLETNNPADAVLAILGRHSERPETIRRILQRIAKMKTSARKEAFSKLMILAGLRKLDTVIQQEAKKMPILDDILDHGVIGPAIRQGRKEGKAEGKLEGKREEAALLLQRLITARFGPPSTTTKRRLAKLTLPELEDLAIKVVSAQNISDLWKIA